MLRFRILFLRLNSSFQAGFPVEKAVCLLLWHFSIFVKADILFLDTYSSYSVWPWCHTERILLYRLSFMRFWEVQIWQRFTMVMKLLLIVQLCRLVCTDLALWDLISVFQLVGWLWRRFCSLPLHLYLFIGTLWAHPETLSKCCQFYVYWWVMLPRISLWNAVTMYPPNEKDLFSWVWSWHGLLYHVGWVLQFLTYLSKVLFISTWNNLREPICN